MRLVGCYMLIALFGAPLAAQQNVEMRNGAPVAPPGVEAPPLTESPIEYATAEGQRIRVSVLLRGLGALLRIEPAE